MPFLLKPLHLNRTKTHETINFIGSRVVKVNPNSIGFQMFYSALRESFVNQLPTNLGMLCTNDYFLSSHLLEKVLIKGYLR